MCRLLFVLHGRVGTGPWTYVPQGLERRYFLSRWSASVFTGGVLRTVPMLGTCPCCQTRTSCSTGRAVVKAAFLLLKIWEVLPFVLRVYSACPLMTRGHVTKIKIMHGRIPGDSRAVGTERTPASPLDLTPASVQKVIGALSERPWGVGTRKREPGGHDTLLSEVALSIRPVQYPSYRLQPHSHSEISKDLQRRSVCKLKNRAPKY
jgi:hypothetical protein